MKSFSTLVLYSAITLFFVDVFANLRLFERVVFDPEYVEPVTGFLVLLLGNGLFGLFLTSALLLPIRLMQGAGRVDQGRLDPGALLIGIVSGLAVIGPMRFHLDWASSEGLMIGLVSLVSGFLGYWLSRRVPLPASSGWQDWVIGLLGFCWWPLMVTLAIVGLGRLHHGYSRSFTTAAILILILGVLVLAARLSARKPVLVVVSLVVPLGFSLLAATAIWRSHFPPGSSNLHSDPPDTALSRPSIILIVLDTVRADHLARFGYSRDTMPSLERWAEQATVGTSAIAPGGWTSPTHASIFSGLSVSDHGVHSGRHSFRTSPRSGVSWLPQKLSHLGYTSVAVTANHLALPEEDLGFDVRISPRRADLAHETLVGYLDGKTGLAQELSETLRWRLPYLDAESIVDLTVRAVFDIEDPVFLFVNLLDAHAPYNPPKSALREIGLNPPTSIDRYWNNRRWHRRWSKLSRREKELVVDLYDGELRGLDWQLARLLSWVEDSFPEALVVITSDHGEELGENGRVGHEFGLEREIIHVPLFIRVPGLPRGEISRVISLSNLHAFILRLASTGVPDPGLLVSNEDLEGYVVSERYPSGRNVESLGPEHGRVWVAATNETHSVIGPSQFGTRYLSLGTEHYGSSIVRDPSDSLLAVSGLIDRYWQERKDPRHAFESSTSDADDLEQLRSLGYVE